MSQHLLAADRLAARRSAPQLLHQGYPLGPHAIVVALNKGLGIGLVQGFSGLTVAVAVLAPLTALAAFAELPPLPARPPAPSSSASPTWSPPTSPRAPSRRRCRPSSSSPSSSPCARRRANPDWRELPLRFVPAALIAVGSVYTYSFPGLIWLVGGRWSLWAAWLALRSRTSGPPLRPLGCSRRRSSSRVLRRSPRSAG